jgi:hypothetical protein
LGRDVGSALDGKCDADSGSWYSTSLTVPAIDGPVTAFAGLFSISRSTRTAKLSSPKA